MKIQDLKTKEPYCKIAPRAKLCLEVEQRRRIGGWVSRVLVLEKTTLHSYKLKGDDGSINTWAIGDSEVYAKRPRKDGRYVVLLTRPHAFNVVFSINSLYEQAIFLQSLSSSGATIMGLYGIFLMKEQKNMQTAIKLSLEDQEKQNSEEKKLYKSMREIKPITKPKNILAMPQLSSRMTGMSWNFNDTAKERRYSAPSSLKLNRDVSPLRNSELEDIIPENVFPSDERNVQVVPQLNRMKSVSDETLSTTRNETDFQDHKDFRINIDDNSSNSKGRKVSELVNIFENKTNEIKPHEINFLNTSTYECNSNNLNQTKDFVSRSLNNIDTKNSQLANLRSIGSGYSLSTSKNNSDDGSNVSSSNCDDILKTFKSLSEKTYESSDEQQIQDEYILSGIIEVSNSCNEEFQRKFVGLKKGGILNLITIENESKLVEFFSRDFFSENKEIICMENLTIFISLGNDGQKYIFLKRDDQCIKVMKFENDCDLFVWKDKLLEETTNTNLPSEKSSCLTEKTKRGISSLGDDGEASASDLVKEDIDLSLDKDLDSPYKGLKRRMAIKRHSRTKNSYSFDEKRNSIDSDIISHNNSIFGTECSPDLITTDIIISTSAATKAATNTTYTYPSTNSIIATTASTINKINIKNYNINNNNSNNRCNKNNNDKIINNHNNNNSSHSYIKNVITLFEHQQNQNEYTFHKRISRNKMFPHNPLDLDGLPDTQSERHPCESPVTEIPEHSANIKRIVDSFNSITNKWDVKYNNKILDKDQADKNHNNSLVKQIELPLESQSVINYSLGNERNMELNTCSSSDFQKEEGEEHEISVTVVKEKFELLSSLIQKNMNLNRSWEHKSICRRKNNRNKIRKKKTLEEEYRRPSIKRTPRKKGFSRESSREDGEISKINQNNINILEIISKENKVLENNCI